MPEPAIDGIGWAEAAFPITNEIITCYGKPWPYPSATPDFMPFH
jgi:hypothetical protein